MKRVFVQSFGCRASQADGSAIEASLIERGFGPVSQARDADLIVVNTCTVTRNADVDARRTLRVLRQQNPQAQILATGCYAQRAPEELAAMDGVRWVVGNSHKHEIAALVENHEAYHGRVWAGDPGALKQFQAAPVRAAQEDRTRPNLKIQDGCGNRCSFCIIPSVRGRSRSAPLESVIEQVGDLASRYVEVVLTGINLGRWGRDLGGMRFADLLRTLLSRTAVQRLRVSSVEPMDWSEDLLRLFAGEERIAKHVHMPLQSGSDAVLKRMFRKYRTRHYASRLELAHRLMPDAAAGSDVMTGFPGETDLEFADTVRFIEQHPFTYLHVFTYSERPGTEAAEMPQVPVEARSERTRILRQLSDRKNREFRRRMLGKTLSAVTLERPGFALTGNFLNVEMAHMHPANRLVQLTIGSLTENGVRQAGALPPVLTA